MQRRPLAAINVTPLVDVLLILLVILMLAMPLFVKKLPVELPKTGLSAAPVATNSLRVSLDTRGDLYLDGDIAELSAVLARISPNTTVELSVDQGVAYGRAAELVVKLQERGPREVMLVTR